VIAFVARENPRGGKARRYRARKGKGGKGASNTPEEGKEKEEVLRFAGGRGAERRQFCEGQEEKERSIRLSGKKEGGGSLQTSRLRVWTKGKGRG